MSVHIEACIAPSAAVILTGGETDVSASADCAGFNVTTGGIMEPHQKRVVDERRARQQELEKLDQFRFNNPVFATLPKEDQNLLRIQSHIMVMLVDVRSQRIERFK